jgi:hypothetical protein
MSEQTYPCPGIVLTESWAGRLEHPVEVLGTCTRKGKPHYRVRVLEKAFRWTVGQILYPPASAVRIRKE